MTSPLIQSRLIRSGLLMPMFSPAVAAAGGLTTLAVEDSATSTAETISTPAGVQAGDLLVLLDHSSGFGTPPTTVVPSGFTSISNITVSSVRQILSYKIATGSEGTLTGMATVFGVNKELYMFRGNVAISSVSVESVNGQGTAGNPTSQSVTASGGTAPLIVIGGYGASPTVAVSPRTMSPAKDGEINATTSSYLAHKIYNSSPADVSVDMDDEGDEITLQSCYLGLS